MNLAKTFYPRESVNRKQIAANKRDCSAKPNLKFISPIVPSDFALHKAAIRKELEAA